MSRRGAVVVFPGQGLLDQSPYAEGDLRAQYAAVADEMGESRDRAASLCDRPLITHEALSLFIYAASIAHYRSLQALGLQPAALVGHGFGEIIALVCGGAFDVAQGADLVLQRSEALRCTAAEPGRMVI